MELVQVIEKNIRQVPQVKTLCQRCLSTSRWQGNIISMIVDAAFTSTGLNYFLTVVPAVKLFNQKYITTGRIRTLDDLRQADTTDLRTIWKNSRSWYVAQNVASYFSVIKTDCTLSDYQAFRTWALNTLLDDWQQDPVGKINGIGINTFQYLRMMGGVDTVMPDKIVKKIMLDIHIQAGTELPDDDIEFIKYMERLAKKTGYRAIELCWMTWLIQSEAHLMENEKYASVLDSI